MIYNDITILLLHIGLIAFDVRGGAARAPRPGRASQRTTSRLNYFVNI